MTAQTYNTIQELNRNLAQFMARALTDCNS